MSLYASGQLIQNSLNNGFTEIDVTKATLIAYNAV